jgi:hypothetical protein
VPHRRVASSKRKKYAHYPDQPCLLVLLPPPVCQLLDLACLGLTHGVGPTIHVTATILQRGQEQTGTCRHCLTLSLALL